MSDPAAQGVEVADRRFPTEAKYFMAIGVFFALIATIYLIFSDGEWIGVSLLYAAVIVALVCAWFMTTRVQGAQADVELYEEGEGDQTVYLPTRSHWPFLLALGTVVTANGFSVGKWLFVPGVIVFLYALAGFIREGRDRA